MNAQKISIQTANNNNFSFELFNYVGENNKNLFLSPFSVSAALAMTYEGAEGKTREEMSDILHFSKNSNIFNADFGEIIEKTQSSTVKGKYTFNVANSIWAQKDFNFLHSYFATVTNFYKAPINLVDFSSSMKREQVISEINKWVESKTNDKIRNFINRSDLDKDTKLILVNAVYFLAEWTKAFKKENTKSDIFYTSNGKIKKDFMRETSRMKYIKFDKGEMLEIPYKNYKSSMIILMPDDVSNFNEFKKGLNSSMFDHIFNKAEYKTINLFLPKFKIEYKKDLAKTLAEAGMKRAFSNSADFSRMVCKKNIRIDKIIHQTFINIDEAGTEAAAATAVIMKRVTSVNPSDKIEFKANKPFVFLIRDNTTGSILFVGQLVK